MRSTHLIIFQLGTEYWVSKGDFKKSRLKNTWIETKPTQSTIQLIAFGLQGLIFMIICISTVSVWAGVSGSHFRSPNPDPGNQKPHTRQRCCVLFLSVKAEDCQCLDTEHWDHAPRSSNELVEKTTPSPDPELSPPPSRQLRQIIVCTIH